MTESTATPVGGKSNEPEMADRGGFAALKDDQGRFRTQSLFWESRHPHYKPVFTTKKREHEGCISMYLKYMEIADPTEYQVAIQLLGSWDHWQALCASKWFKELVGGWREELKIRMASERYWEMRSVAEMAAGTPQGIQATKWLSEQYGEKPKPKRGRPSKAEKEAALKQASEDERDLAEDAASIGLVKTA
jgi:hypothetical protein